MDSLQYTPWYRISHSTGKKCRLSCSEVNTLSHSCPIHKYPPWQGCYYWCCLPAVCFVCTSWLNLCANIYFCLCGCYMWIGEIIPSHCVVNLSKYTPDHFWSSSGKEGIQWALAVFTPGFYAVILWVGTNHSVNRCIDCTFCKFSCVNQL